jgi:hypothetical protein
LAEQRHPESGWRQVGDDQGAVWVVMIVSVTTLVLTTVVGAVIGTPRTVTVTVFVPLVEPQPAKASPPKNEAEMITAKSAILEFSVRRTTLRIRPQCAQRQSFDRFRTMENRRKYQVRPEQPKRLNHHAFDRSLHHSQASTAGRGWEIWTQLGRSQLCPSRQRIRLPELYRTPRGSVLGGSLQRSRAPVAWPA